MAEASRMHRVEADSPLRCQAVSKTRGQCLFERIEESQFCPMHSGPTGDLGTDRKQIRNYRLNMWQARMEEFADNPEVKSLREEVGITRIVLEETMNRCETPTDLLMYSNKIADLVMKIEKLVSSCHRLEAATGSLLDKSSALQLASIIIDIINRHITDEVILQLISEELIEAIISQHTKPIGKLEAV